MFHEFTKKTFGIFHYKGYFCIPVEIEGIRYKKRTGKNKRL